MKTNPRPNKITKMTEEEFLVIVFDLAKSDILDLNERFDPCFIF